MFDAALAAALDDVQEAGDVALHVQMRVLGGIADAGLGGKVHDPGEAFAAEQGLHGLAVRKLDLLEAEVRIALQQLQARELQPRIVVGVEVVEAGHVLAALQQRARGVKADETGRTGDQELHALRQTVAPPEALSTSFNTCSWAASSASVARTTGIL